MSEKIVQPTDVEIQQALDIFARDYLTCAADELKEIQESGEPPYDRMTLADFVESDLIAPEVAFDTLMEEIKTAALLKLGRGILVGGTLIDQAKAEAITSDPDFNQQLEAASEVGGGNIPTGYPCAVCNDSGIVTDDEGNQWPCYRLTTQNHVPAPKGGAHNTEIPD